MTNLTVEERFWSKVSRKGPDECWDWTASTLGKGYGAFLYAGSMKSASRVAWTLTHGDPGELFVCHHCDRPICCNTNHMFLGTNRDNMQDMLAKGRGKKTGPRGESLSFSKLTDAIVRAIRGHAHMGVAKSDLARAFGVSKQLISAVCLRQVWGHIE